MVVGLQAPVDSPDPRRAMLARGVVFGACFPLAAWTVELAVGGLEPSLANVVRIHAAHPAHWFVDLTPVVLGWCGWAVGRRERRVLQLNAELEALVARRTAQLRRALDAAERASSEADGSKREAEAALEARTRFLAAMGHELRTPLTGVLGWLELLETRGMDPSQHRAVSLARRAASALLQVVGSVIDFAKVDRGELELNVGPARLDSLLEGVVDLLRPSAATKNVGLSVEIDPAVGDGWFACDRARLGQVLANLLGNAIKFTDEGQVFLRCKKTERGLRFEVEDNGIGIAPDLREAIFGAFVQADGTSTRRFGGSGLGLPIAARLVAAMGGTIGVESELGVGSNFYFELPLARTEPVGDPDEPDVPARAPDRAPQVLVVDDSPIAAEVAIAQLEALGAETEWVESGEEAVERVLSQPFHLVLMDRHMPGIDGVEATRRIRTRERGRRTPIVALSASALQEEVTAGEQAGMDGHLLKPLPLSDLRDALERFAADPGAEPSPR